MTRFLLRFLALATSFGLVASSAQAGAIIDGDPADGMIVAGVVNNPEYNHLYDYQIGALYNSDNSSMVEGFPLPYLAPGQQVTGATISFYLESLNGPPNFNLALYGLKRVSTTSGAPLASDQYSGANDTANTLLAAKFITPTSTPNQASTYSGANLATFVQSQYSNSAFSGMDLSKSRFIFFRLSPDSLQGGNYLIADARNPLRTYHPTLALTISNGISNVAGRLQFSFTLPQDSDTSAGVYDATTGKLLRTIWNNVRYQAGTNYGVWDGKNDAGTALPTGTNYKIKLIYHNVQYIFQGMIGNTSAAQRGPNLYHSFGKIHDLSLSGNAIFYSIGYNELECPYHFFAVGSPQVPKEVNFGYGLTDVYASMYLVTSDSVHSYWARTYGGLNGTNTYVVAMSNGASPTTNATFYTFPKGVTPTGANQSTSSCVDFDSTPNQPNSASGIAVQQSGNCLFVAHSNLNIVRVFDKIQGNSLGSFAVTNPGRIATTANGDVWVISNGTTPSVTRYTFSNGSATVVQTLTGFKNPCGVGVSADDSLVLVADGGTSQQIKAFSNSTGTAAWTYGVAGGIAGNGPTIAANTFEFSTQRTNFNDFAEESSICFQPDNTFWITDGGNSRVVHYSITNNTPTYIEQITFNDTSYRSTVDVTDATRVFNNFLEYSVDYSKPLGGTNGSWSLVRNWAYGLPNDATHLYYGSANGFINVATLSNGRTYGFLGNMLNNNWDLFELPATGPARYTGYSFTNFPRMYEDGTLRFNSGPNSTTLSYYSQPLTGFDALNNPVWGSPTLLGSSALRTTDPVPWAAFPMRTEITASGMLVDFNGNYQFSGYHLAGMSMGSSSSFQWEAGPSVNGTSTGWFPQDGEFDTGDGVEYPGNHVMAMGRNIIYGYNGEFWGGGQASQWVNYLDNGLMVGLFGTYESSSSVGSSAVDGFAGNAFSPTLVRGPDGNVYLYHNDECNHGGTNRWLISGWDGIVEVSTTGAVGGTAAMGADTQGPVVSVTSPTAGAIYDNGNSLVLSASVSGTGAGIASVQFFDGSTSLGIITVAPYTLNYSGLSAGAHTITAKATDSNGLSTTSAPVNITIGADGQSAPPAAPASLATGTVASGSVGLHWTQPAVGTTSSTIGQIVSFQFTATGDGKALSPSTVAGAPNYAVANFNILPQTSTNEYVDVLNNSGAKVTSLGINMSVGGTNDSWSLSSITGTATQLLADEVYTPADSAITISNIPFASYDVVVYSQPDGVNFGAASATLSVSDGAYSTSTYTNIKQSFTKNSVNYTVATVPFGATTTITNCNTIVVQGLTSPIMALQGSNIAGFQIVERPLDQGTPTSYAIQRAAGTGGTFTTVGTVSGTTLSFTDSTVSAGTAYQYRVQAIDGTGSAYSTALTVTTPTAATGGSGGTTTTTTTPPANYASWQAQYFTAAQLADPTISGPGADPYGTTIPNLLAYALQLNPATATPANVPDPVIVNGHLSITYSVPTAITDINFIVEVSSNLVTWNTGTGYTTVVSNVTTSSGHTITVQDTLPTTTQKHFMRLRVTQK
jgi:hypothetical protein